MKRLTVFAAYFVVISSAHELCTREDAERLSYEIAELKENNQDTYIGCFIDVVRDRDLTNLQGFFPATHATPNTLDFCSKRCRILGFIYMGVQNGQDCWCSNTYGKHGEAPHSQCNVPCPGNRDTMCGAGQRNSIYKLVQTHNENYVGCFIDVGRDRDMTNFQGLFPATHATPNTLGFCSVKCRKLGFKYMGVQNGQDCWCSNTYGKHGEAPQHQCNVSCPGNKETMCGAVYRNSIYIVGHKDTYIGCFVDVTSNRDMSNLQGFFPASHVTPNSLSFCSRRCRANGFKYMGVQNGQDCWCSNTYGKHGEAHHSSCNIPCPGYRDDMCGGLHRNSIYKLDG
ncbi:unnamed protein product [Owenia fusiformis]|uniref:Uncharacterized protein n=1 Tax=Owenia fusiformis TaxID=6347 RepID=A0A8J1XIG2_OWEFU|nr:unnamed protein product [Owenia fusiformis]